MDTYSRDYEYEGQLRTKYPNATFSPVYKHDRTGERVIPDDVKLLLDGGKIVEAYNAPVTLEEGVGDEEAVSNKPVRSYKRKNKE